MSDRLSGDSAVTQQSPPFANTPDRTAWVSGLVVLVVSVAFSLAVGARFGILNHNSYLVHGLGLSDPELLANDWLVQSQSYHPVFDVITAALFRLGLGPFPFVAATLLAGIVFGYLVWLLVDAVAPSRYRMLVFLFLMALLSVTKTSSVMVTYIHVSEFQPSTLGGLAMLGAIVAFVRGSYLVSGVFLAATAVHLNYLVLGGPLFFLAHLMLGREDLLRRLVRQLALPTAALVPFVPLILSIAAEGDPLARTLLFDIRSPHHYRPVAARFVGFVAWHFLAAAAMSYAPARNPADRRMRVLTAIMFVLVMIATALTTVVFIPTISQLFVWRLAPFSLLMAWLATLAVVVPICFDYQRRLSTAAVVTTVAVTLFANVPSWLRVAIIGTMGLVWFMRFVANKSPDGLLGERLLRGAGTVVFVGIMTFALSRASWVVTPIQAEEKRLYEWVHSTDRAATFLVPPDMDNFRLNGRRPIVVDWKSPPIDSPGILEWYRRLQLVSGVRDLETRSAARDGYAAIDAERLQRILEEFPVDYIVLRGADVTVPGAEFEAVFSNERFTVLSLDKGERVAATPSS